MKPALLALVLVLAGGGCGPRRVIAVENRNAKTLANLVRQAERTFAESLALDYRAPLSFRDPVIHFDPFTKRAFSARLYSEACLEGHKPACWWAMWILGSRDPASARVEVGRNCANGDMMSCRAAQAEPSADPPKDEPGTAGRSNACREGWGSIERARLCDVDGLERECVMGFATSCYALVSHAVTSLPGVETRAIELAVAGCRGGLVNECAIVIELARETSDGLVAAETLCAITLRDDCIRLAWDHINLGDLVKARDVLERRCQLFGTLRECAALIEAYLDGTIPEPLSHRGRTLLDFLCKGLPSDDRTGLCERTGA